MILGQIVNGKPALERLAQTPLKATTAYRLRLLIQQVRPLLTAYEETRVALVKEMGAVDEKGNFSVKPENYPAFQAQMEPMLGEAVVLNFKPFDIADLGDTAVTAVDLMALDWLFDNPKTESKGDDMAHDEVIE